MPEKLSKLHKEFKHQTATAIIAALGLLIALVWKDLITKIMEHITTPSLLIRYPYLAELYTVLIVTGVSVLGILLISNWIKKE